MALHLNPETERVIGEELGKGRFQSVDDLILAGVRALSERNNLREASTPPGEAVPSSSKERARKFVEWARNHPSTPPLSDEAVSRARLNPDRW